MPANTSASKYASQIAERRMVKRERFNKFVQKRLFKKLGVSGWRNTITDAQHNPRRKPDYTIAGMRVWLVSTEKEAGEVHDGLVEHCKRSYSYVRITAKSPEGRLPCNLAVIEETSLTTGSKTKTGKMYAY